MTTPDAFAERLVAIRRDLHQHPELSWEETRTARRVSETLTDLGIPHRTGVAGTGIIADLPGQRPGPAVALRADMDALPIQEETGLPFASTNPGVMHACAHDGHVTIALGAAMLLAADPPAVGVRLLFQPAEEVGRGALAMIEHGAVDGVGMVFGGHIDPTYPVGTIVVHEGPVNASSDAFEITVQGRGGHAARPHEGVDPIVIGAHVVTAIQSIVAREINPAHAAVVTVGKFTAGTAANVIASRATLSGTIRTQAPGVRDQIVAALERTARSVAEGLRGEASVTVERGTPPLVNTPEMAALARDAVAEAVGPDAAGPLRTANMGGEDFAYYLDHAPGFFARYGAGKADGNAQPAHSSRFDFDERVLPIAARYLAELARRAAQRLAADA